MKYFIRAAVVFFTASSSVHAVDKHWNAASGNWGLSTNWNPTGAPGTSDIAYVDFFSNGSPGVASVVNSVASPISINIANGDTVSIGVMGTLPVQGDLIVGVNSTFGNLNVNSPSPELAYFGNVTIGNTLRVGMFSGVGTVNQNDGIVTANQLVRVGDRNDPTSEFTGSGVYNLTGFGVLNAARLEVGYGGDSSQFPLIPGTFNLSGNATLNISLNAQIPDPKIGGNGSSGVFNQTGGFCNSPNRVINIGQGNAGSGVYNFSGGTLAAAGLFVDSNGTINYTGGSNLFTGQLSTTNGHVLLSSGGNKVLRTSVLFTSLGAWSIDLSDNAMIVNSTFGETVASALKRGYNNGAWNGNGIKSSAAAIASPHPHALGYGTATELGISSFLGFPVSGSTNVIRYTFAGDANLDGIVDVSDLGRLATNWQASSDWAGGDFNYDGVVNVTDLGALATNWQQGAASAAAGEDSFESALASVGLSGVFVPEPGALGAAVVLFMLLLRKRRKDAVQTSHGALCLHCN